MVIAREPRRVARAVDLLSYFNVSLASTQDIETDHFYNLFVHDLFDECCCLA